MRSSFPMIMSSSNDSAANQLSKPPPAAIRRRSTLDEKKDRRPELINSVPHFYMFDNDKLVSAAYAALLKAQSCWLSAPEIMTLLEFSKECGLGAQTPNRPPSGSVFYYDSRSGVCFRRDGYAYIKKKGSAISVREDHVKLRIGNVAVIYASYVHSSEHFSSPSTESGDQTSLFHRRSYWLVNSLEKERGVIVHYLSSGDGSEDIEPSAAHNSATCECILCSMHRVQVPQGYEHRALGEILARCPTSADDNNTSKRSSSVNASAATARRRQSSVEEKAIDYSNAAAASSAMDFLLDDDDADFDPYDPEEDSMSSMLLDQQQLVKQEAPPPPRHSSFHSISPPPASLPPPPQQQQQQFMAPFKPPKPNHQLPPLPPTTSAAAAAGFQQQNVGKKNDKPQIRFDAINMHIVECSPQTTITSCEQRILLVIGMRKHPESLNYRTWTEKVMPKLTIAVGRILVDNIESVCLGVVRFKCPSQVIDAGAEISVTFDLGGTRGVFNVGFAPQVTPPRFGLQPSSSAPFDIGKEEADVDGEPYEPQEDGDVTLDRQATVMVERAVRELLKAHASHEVLNEPAEANGYNFLHSVVFCQASLDLVEMLLDHGADLHLKTQCAQGNTALHLAVENGSLEFVELLMRRGANPNAENNMGQTPLDLADTYQMIQALSTREPATTAAGKRMRTNSTASTGTASHNAHITMLRQSLGTLTISEQATLAMAVDHRKSSCHDLDEYSMTSMEDSYHLAETAPEMDVDQLVTEAQPKIYEMMRKTMDEQQLARINHEAIKIQSNVRAWILRKKFLETQEAATKIQALAKGHLARKEYHDLRDKVTNTLVIQKCFRRHREAKRQLQQQRTSPSLRQVISPSAAAAEQQQEEDFLMPPELFLSLD